jgi:hypothetical protein
VNETSLDSSLDDKDDDEDDEYFTPLEETPRRSNALSSSTSSGQPPATPTLGEMCSYKGAFAFGKCVENFRQNRALYMKAPMVQPWLPEVQFRGSRQSTLPTLSAGSDCTNGFT